MAYAQALGAHGIDGVDLALRGFVMRRVVGGGGRVGGAHAADVEVGDLVLAGAVEDAGVALDAVGVGVAGVVEADRDDLRGGGGHRGGAVGVEGIGYDRRQSGLNANGGVAKPAYIHRFISPVCVGLADVLGLRSAIMGEIDSAT